MNAYEPSSDTAMSFADSSSSSAFWFPGSRTSSCSRALTAAWRPFSVTGPAARCALALRYQALAFRGCSARAASDVSRALP
eukprot:3902194-Pyramimonas_sp.AAC.2